MTSLKSVSIALLITLLSSNVAQATCLSKYEDGLRGYRQERNSSLPWLGLAGIVGLFFAPVITIAAAAAGLIYDNEHVDYYNEMIDLLKDSRKGDGPALSKLHSEIKAQSNDFRMTQAELAEKLRQADGSEKMCTSKMIDRSELKQALLTNTWFGTPGDPNRDPRVADDLRSKSGAPLPSEVQPTVEQPDAPALNGNINIDAQ